LFILAFVGQLQHEYWIKRRGNQPEPFVEEINTSDQERVMKQPRLEAFEGR
jgi:hypothetical protein